MPTNAGYYVAAYSAAAIIYLAYGFSVVARARDVRARLRELELERPTEQR